MLSLKQDTLRAGLDTGLSTFSSEHSRTLASAVTQQCAGPPQRESAAGFQRTASTIGPVPR